MTYWNEACSPDSRTPVTNEWHPSAAMQISPLYVLTQRRDLAARYATTTRQWLVARTLYRRLHEAPVKNLTALRDAARRRFGLRPGGPVLMATGGSQGARSINAAVSGAARALRAAGVQVLHITGPQHAVEVPDGHLADPPYVVIPYVGEMQYAYAAADFVICRSGAMTCAELTAAGLPAAYVPLPLRGGEQRLNAEPVVAAGGGLLVDDAGLDRAWIEATLIPVLTDPGRIATMSARASAAGAPDADVVLARHVLSAVAERRRFAA